MYPRNAASPEPIAIGAVVQISDGAVQTSGCTVRIKPIGVAEADGGGTTAYSTDGIVLYTPTQAETNYTSFVLIAKKTGCIPVAITVITSASATAGYAGTDQSKIANPTSTVALTGTTIATTQQVDVNTIKTQTVMCSGGVTIPAATLASTTNITAATGVVLSGVTHTGAVIPTVTDLTNMPSIPANWITTAGIADGAITNAKFAAGAISSTTFAAGAVDGTALGNSAISQSKIATGAFTAAKFSAGAIDAAALATDACDEIADHVWDEVLSGHLTAGTTGAALNGAGSAGDPWSTALPGAYGAGTAGKIVGDNLNATVSSRSTLAAADVRSAIGMASANLDTQILTLATAANLATVAGYIDTEITTIINQTTASAIRSAVGLASANLDTQLSAISGYMDTEVGAIKTVTDKLDTAMELDGIVYRFTVNALEQAPSGGGGGSTDWTADERTAIRTILGVPAVGTTPDEPTAGALKVIDDFLDTEVAAIKAKTDNLPSDPADASDIAASFSTVNSTLATITTYVDTEVASIKTVTDKVNTAMELSGGLYRFTAAALALAPAGGGGGLGSGPNSVVFTIDDGNSSPIEGAAVSAVLNNVREAQGLTDINGQVTFGLTTATYEIVVRAQGYENVSVDRVISGSGAAAPISLTLFEPDASLAGLVTGYYDCYDEDLNLDPGVEVTMILVDVPATYVNMALTNVARTKTSNNSGRVQFNNLLPGATYYIRRGTIQNQIEETVTIPADATSPVDLNSIVGNP